MYIFGSVRVLLDGIFFTVSVEPNCSSLQVNKGSHIFLPSHISFLDKQPANLYIGSLRLYGKY